MLTCFASGGPASVAPNGAPVEAESLRALAEAAKLCAELGHRVEEVEPEIDGAAVVPAFLTLASANTVVNLASHPTKGRPPLADEVEKVTYALSPNQLLPFRVLWKLTRRS